MQKIVFSGVQPTGTLHIGNYLGAIKQFVALQRNHDAVFCVVDEHAITIPQEPSELSRNTLSVAALYLAAGIDPKKSIIFIQSHVSAHAELAWILNTLTPLGELERMTQFKDKARNADKKGGVMAGLMNYPTLMAADILLYHTNLVPVGEDQKQHLELARSIARRFNQRFGEIFAVPEAYIPKEVARIMGLDNPKEKMSKSASSPQNYVALLDAPDVIRKKIMAAVTDSGSEVRYDPAGKPAISNLMVIYHAFSGDSFHAIEKRYRGKGYADFKRDCAEILIINLAPIQKRHAAFMKDKKKLFVILQNGAKRARITAEKTLRNVQDIIGFIPAKLE